jgi:AcrR family transcriptional regulator
MREIAAELRVSERTLTRWFKRPEVQAEQGRAQDEARAEHPLSIRTQMEQQLLACRRDGSPDWTARAQAARILADLPEEDASEPQVLMIRVLPDGSREEIHGTGLRVPAAVTLVVDAPERTDNDGWQ